MEIKAELANEAVKIVTGARRSAYGKPEQNFERIARLWNAHLDNTGRSLLHNDDARAGASAPLTPTDVATFCRFIKEARLAETPDHRDSFVDIIGYLLCQAELALPAPPPEEEALARALDKAAGHTFDWGACGVREMTPDEMRSVGLRPTTVKIKPKPAAYIPAEPPA